MALWYRSAVSKMMNKEIDWDSDNIVATLHSSTYAPNRDTHAYVSSLTNELATGGGYTNGGVALSGKTITFTVANSWANARANSTAYSAGYIFRPATANGYLYRVTVAGTSAASPPTFPTVVGQTVADGTATITNVGSAITVLSASSVSWAAATFTGARYMVISDRTPGTAATQPLIGLVDFGSDQAGGGGTFQVTFDGQGILQVFTA